MNAKKYKSRRLTDIEAILILSKNDSVFQTAKRINDLLEAKSKEAAEERYGLAVENFRMTFEEEPGWPYDKQFRLAAFGKEGEG